MPFFEKANAANKLFLLLFLVLFLGFMWSFWGYWNAKTKLELLSTPEGQQEMSKEEVQKVLAQVSKHILVPTDEEPVLATVLDVESLQKDQAFYKDAKNGDKVLFYLQAKKAILFDVENDLIVNVGPLTVTEDAAASTQDEGLNTEVETLSVEIRNGTTTAGLATTLKGQLEALGSYTVSKLADAANEEYEETVLVDLTGGENQELVAGLEEELDVELVTDLPQGEASSSADVLIIIGQ